MRIALRNIFRNKFSTFIILISLSFGITCTWLVGVFVHRELTTDRFHTDSQQIYGLSIDDPFNSGAKMFFASDGAAQYMKDNYEQVEDYCLLLSTVTNKVTVNSNSFHEQPNTIAVSPNFFDFFSYQLISKSTQNVLGANNSVVLSEELAHKYFGATSPLGQVIEIEELIRPFRKAIKRTYVVSGTFRKPIPNSHLQFDIVTMLERGDSRAFIRLASDVKESEMESIFAEHKNQIPVIHTGIPGAYYLDNLSSNYFNKQQHSESEKTRDKADIYIVLAIAITIFLISIINYLSLINNAILIRVKSFVVRRVNGASTAQNLLSIMYEVVLLVIGSLLLSAISIGLFLPYFNQLLETTIPSAYFIQISQILLVVAVFLLLVLTSLIFILFRLKQVSAVNILTLNKKAGSNATSPIFRQLQISSTIVLIIVSITIIKQLDYQNNKLLGFDKDVLVLNLPSKYYDQAKVFKEELIHHSCIENVSVAAYTPLMGHPMARFNYVDGGEEKIYTPCGFGGDVDYLQTLGIKIISGEDFSSESTNKDKCLVNESLLHLFPKREIIGEKLPGTNKLVIGIVEDFHYSNLRNLVRPSIIELEADGTHILVKPTEGNSEEANQIVTTTWQKLIPDYPENKIRLMERYELLHAENYQFIRLIAVCSLISIFLSMIGLFTTSLHMSHIRTKEIGIRKVNGASISEILTMLNKDFIKWVAIAFVIACPIGWYAMDKWLENFAYKTNLSWWIFALAGVVALGIALLTVSWQSWRTARQNPVEALRYE
ncbi:MAG: ABC transporter permease [Carboxylicivirga sp.]|jgi:putative ABC transport system permease protein|nr:ABC transporter permease [Carboxylicivirga sp.]